MIVVTTKRPRGHETPCPAERHRLATSSEGLLRAVARECCRRWTLLRSLPWEDVLSEGRVALLKAARDYDPQKAAWSTCASVYVKNHLQRVATMITAVRRGRVGQTVPFSVIEAGGSRTEDGAPYEPPDRRGPTKSELCERMTAAEHVAYALRWCSSRMREVLRLRSEGWTLEEVAGRLGVTRERVRQVERQGHERCRTALARRRVYG